MNGRDIILGLNYIGEDFIEEAENARFPFQANQKNTHRKIHRPLLIAAIIALALLLVGCGAIIAMRLQQLTIREKTAGISSETGFRGEEINLISIQGFMGTDSYAAFQE